MTCRLTTTLWMGSLLWAGALLAADSPGTASARVAAGDKHLLLEHQLQDATVYAFRFVGN